MHLLKEVIFSVAEKVITFQDSFLIYEDNKIIQRHILSNNHKLHVSELAASEEIR
jgi:hypothetical protein